MADASTPEFEKYYEAGMQMARTMAMKADNDIINLMLQEEPVKKTEHKFTTEEGLDLIGGARMKNYGVPGDNLNDIGAAWTPYVKRAIVKGHLDGTDVALLMVLLKVIRQVGGYHRDSTTDICGYAALAETLNEPSAYEALLARAGDQSSA